MFSKQSSWEKFFDQNKDKIKFRLWEEGKNHFDQITPAELHEVIITANEILIEIKKPWHDTGHNLCLRCHHDKGCGHNHNIILADCGVCSRCGYTDDVWDCEVSNLVEQSGIDPKLFWNHGTRLRTGDYSNPDRKAITIEEIKQQIDCLVNRP